MTQAESYAISNSRGTRTRPLSVLVADDDSALRDYLSCILEWSGCTVVEAEDGLQVVERLAAIAEAGAAAPDVIISDIAMPGVSGLGLLEVAAAFTRNVPVILMTGRRMALFSDQAALHGAAALVGKPFDPWALCKLVHEIARPLPAGALRGGSDSGCGQT